MRPVAARMPAGKARRLRQPRDRLTRDSNPAAGRPAAGGSLRRRRLASVYPLSETLTQRSCGSRVRAVGSSCRLGHLFSFRLVRDASASMPGSAASPSPTKTQSSNSRRASVGRHAQPGAPRRPHSPVRLSEVSCARHDRQAAWPPCGQFRKTGSARAVAAGQPSLFPSVSCSRRTTRSTSHTNTCQVSS